MNAMTLQDILAMQAARQRAYEADLDDMVRYGKGALFTSTVIVDLYKMFDQNGENLMGLRLEIPTEVTLGQLVQLLGEVTQEQFSDAFFLEQLQPYFSGIVADEWQESSQTLEYFTSSQCSDLLLRPEGTALDDQRLAAPGRWLHWICVPAHDVSGKGKSAGSRCARSCEPERCISLSPVLRHHHEPSVSGGHQQIPLTHLPHRAPVDRARWGFFRWDQTLVHIPVQFFVSTPLSTEIDRVIL